MIIPSSKGIASSFKDTSPSNGCTVKFLREKDICARIYCNFLVQVVQYHILR
jgi:hypothetical protein